VRHHHARGTTGEHPLMTLPIEPGATGEEVRDLHRRLAIAGFGVVNAPLHTFTEVTGVALEAFQRDRGLEPTGRCDAQTWQMLVEAGYRLGDRHLYLQAPMLRGDDVAELQLRLGSLGFDAGRVDGIFGPKTEHALAEFQRNAGLTTDGIAGRATIGELCRLGTLVDRSSPVAVVRERERLRHAPRDLHGRRVVVGELGGLDALTTALGRALREGGASVLLLHEPDESVQAAAANQFDADLYVGLAITDRPTVSYFATAGFESAGGRQLAALCTEAIELTLGATPLATGMRLPILRETRMPAVLCRVAPADVVVARTAELAQSLARAVAAWVSTPVADA
jgi:N-acetylmuramoyl-L-alanine amidase